MSDVSVLTPRAWSRRSAGAFVFLTFMLNVAVGLGARAVLAARWPSANSTLAVGDIASRIPVSSSDAELQTAG